MTLTSIGSFLRQARKEAFAIPLFDAFDSTSVEGFVQAFEALHAPGIIAIYAPVLDQPHGPALAAYIRSRVESSRIPLSLMLDHGGSFEMCVRAIQLGFTDVMFDGSRLPFEENLEKTRLVVNAAHACGLGAEAELGHVGSGSDYQQFGAQRAGFTDPVLVERFAQETGVDFLAVAVGNAHGLYQGKPHLDMELLETIQSKTGIPLVLHGGTGISEGQFRQAIRLGIAKVNVATDLFLAAGKGIASACQSGETSYFNLNEQSIAIFKQRCEYFIRLFGAEGKAE